MVWRVGVDSGGTFTDLCLFDDATGRIAVWKVSSTPDDPSFGIIEGIVAALERVGAAPEDVVYFGHGTTVATNALIQRRGARTGLITTDGFRDLLEIGRQKRPELYDLMADKPVPLVPRDLRLEVPERLRHDGSVETPLDEQAFRSAARRLRDADVRAIAVCFLYGFLNPVHERAALRILAEECPDVFVCASHLVAPEFREFERLSTTVVNAFLGPVMRSYVHRLGERLRALGVRATPHLTQSNGGVISFEQAERLPVRTVLSGPSTGVIGAREIGTLTGHRDVITFDMGGTSTDVALLRDGECQMTSEAVIHGYPIKAPMSHIHTVGAGGGSIAFDDGGILKVGPRSAGASPGPACYGLGNTEPTVTDACVVLGLLNPEHLLGGRLKVRQDLAWRSIETLAGALGLDPMTTAAGILAVVTANMVRAIRVISVQKGYDPREHALMAFGGAGPLHAARLAQELEIRTVLVPRYPGILCAMGLLLTDLRADFALTRLRVLTPAALADAREAFDVLDRAAAEWFDREDIAESDRRLKRGIDMRYAGQNYELFVPLSDDGLSRPNELARRFAEIHDRVYGFTAEEEPIQMVTFRVEATGLVPKARLSSSPERQGHVPRPMQRRNVWLREAAGFQSCPVYDRDDLRGGDTFAGPAIIEQMDATTFVPPGMTGKVDTWLNIILEAT